MSSDKRNGNRINQRDMMLSGCTLLAASVLGAKHQNPAQGSEGRLAFLCAADTARLPRGAGRYLDEPTRVPLGGPE
jgi:hypothetical protein